ncbi:MAG: HEAT repeat domain-containing protein [Planctomycetes bacterium]|nr:HEAT repeat domain-containing protein [Planctomycetota bacterium]
MADINEILSILTDENQPYPARIDCLEDLLACDDPRVIDAVLGAITSEERYLRRKAAEVLGRFNEPRVIDSLAMAATTDADEAVRRNAVRSLGSFTDPSAIDALYRAAKDESLIVSKEAAKVLQKVRGSRTEIAKERLKEEADRIRGTVAPPAPPPVSPPAPPTPWEPPPVAPPAPPEPKPKKRRPKPKPKPEAPPEPAPPPNAEPEAVTPPARAKGYVPPALARLPALRGLSASEELGWPDLLNTFSLARKRANMIFSALGLAWVFVGYAVMTFLFGVNPNAPALADLHHPEWFIGAVVLWAWVFLAGTGFKIARSTAIELATGHAPGIGPTYKFWLLRLTYPLRPLIVVAILLAIPVGLVLLAGYLSGLPVAGEVIAVIAYPVCLLIAGIAVFMLLGSVAGLPMMVPAMVVENTGCGDAVTSAWAYVISRPWRYVLYWLSAALHCLFVVGLLVAGVYLTEIGLSLGAGWPLSYDLLPHLMPGLSPLGMVHSVILFVIASYVLSHYFTSRVGIYLLMRKAVDGIDIDVVHLPKKSKAVPGRKADEKGNGSLL